MTLTCAITEVSPSSGGAASIECWRAIFSTSCNRHTVPMMNQSLVKTVCFTLIYFSFISNNQQKYRKCHVFSNPRTFLIKHLICYNFLRISRIPETTSQYPVSLEIFPQISRIPVIFFREYPVSRKPLIGPQLTTTQPVSSITHKNQERII